MICIAKIIEDVLNTTFCKTEAKQLNAKNDVIVTEEEFFDILNEPSRGKTNNLPRRKQRRRSASQ